MALAHGTGTLHNSDLGRLPALISMMHTLMLALALSHARTLAHMLALTLANTQINISTQFTDTQLLTAYNGLNQVFSESEMVKSAIFHCL